MFTRILRCFENYSSGGSRHAVILSVLHTRLLQWGVVVFHRCAGCFYTRTLHGFLSDSSVEDLCCIQGVCNLSTRIHCGLNHVVCLSKVALVHDMRA